MIEFALTLVIFLLVVTGMAIGVLRGRPAISGSCGGLNHIPGVESDCGGTCRVTCKRRLASSAAKPGTE
jgi:hypothetical protein